MATDIFSPGYCDTCGQRLEHDQVIERALICKNCREVYPGSGYYNYTGQDVYIVRERRSSAAPKKNTLGQRTVKW